MYLFLGQQQHLPVTHNMIPTMVPMTTTIGRTIAKTMMAQPMAAADPPA
jgi:hypothetical protein